MPIKRKLAFPFPLVKLVKIGLPRRTLSNSLIVLMQNKTSARPQAVLLTALMRNLARFQMHIP
ncbi:MAG: hypothetical protein WBN22_04310 [Verrucomicrobiia bacterium]